MIDLLWDANEQIAGGMKPLPLTIVQVVTEKHLFRDAVVIRNQGNHKSVVCIFSLPSDPLPVVYEEDNPNGDFESAARHNRTTYVHIQHGEQLAYECIEINNCMITHVYNEPIVSIKEKHLNFIRKTQIGEK